MNNIFLITKREFLTQVKKKSFVILTLLAPLMIIAFGAVVGMMFKANQSHNVIEVVDNSGLFKGQLKSDEKINYVFIPSAEEQSKLNNLKGNETLDGILILPPLSGNNFDDLEKSTRLVVNTKIGFDTKQQITSDITNVIKKEKIKQLGIQEAQLADLDKSFTLKTINVSEDNKEDSDLAFGVKSALSMVLMYVTFMFIIIYGVRVMRSVLEEKNNRVVEIIISSVKPFELMMGKILGVTMVALTQFIVWIMMSVAGALVLNTGFSSLQKNIPGGNEELMSKLDITQIATQVSHSLLELNFPLIIFVFIIFFLLGYMFYSSVYAAIGSAVDNETETQQFTLFAILPLTLGMYGSISVINNPDGPVGFWMSIIPFTSPVAMVARIPFGVPAWQIALSIGLLLGTTIFMIFLAGKIYRVGILMYGNKATLKEIWKWIRG
ncbi:MULTISPECIES: ABC transporter permease [Chryseobacterium]|uniref:ABC transporter permease n=1 Tax=Chryseobacterium TaxID=59732 RepID=UPI00195D1CA6|nr:MULTISPECIES: ABC transporter permease [Chryseobacterium]MBM7419229.1 ABC-2 type transport system permease protein [Chryseobacterium sp. JUb44]MDH6209152.1 ABC-2 type transport system permease protein [Chryseobacterium sp. BIGb0186]WSO12002.1 ABC transporter permease [Chryseobacterium scophthalmum]